MKVKKRIIKKKSEAKRTKVQAAKDNNTTKNLKKSKPQNKPQELPVGRQLNLADILRLNKAVYAGSTDSDSMFVGNNGVWKAYQSVISYFPFKCPEFDCSVNIKNLKTVFAIFDKIEVEFAEKQVIISKNDITVKFPYMETDKSDLDIFRGMQDNAENLEIEWQKVPGNLAEAVSVATRTVSENPIHGTLTCFSFSELGIITSNNISLTAAKLDSPFATCLLDKRALLGVLGITPTHFKATKNFMLFINADGVIVQLPIVLGSFPDFFHLLGIKGIDFVEFDREKLKQIASLSEGLFDGNNLYDNSLTIKIENNVLEIKNHSSMGTVKGKMAVVSEKDFSFSIDSQTLMMLTEVSAKIGLNDNKVVVDSEGLKLISSLGE